MLSLEIIEALTNDVEFVDLACDWIYERNLKFGWILGKEFKTNL